MNRREGRTIAKWAAFAASMAVAAVLACGAPLAEKPEPKAMNNETKDTSHDAPKHTNRLVGEKSPYLLQHAHNPVNWHPWGDQAFEKAKKEDKPIFLSIGYSTCHWCHVMEKESFEDEEIAGLMNDVFVCIKVDREERPDVDHLYMTVCQAMTGSGGWPLTILMTPDKRPFFATTYIPRESRHGRAGMKELIAAIRKAWKTRRPELLENAERVMTFLKSASTTAAGEAPGEAVLKRAYEDFARSFDGEHGGFGGAPKFPTPHNLLFLLRWWKRTGDARALQMVETTLRQMRLGGVYDHVGFGFHRYSTDARWLVPHFEKMLYDQALLVLAYAEAFQATGKAEYERTAREILTYVLRDMTSPEGAFYSAEDADSEGEEGKFYVWTLKEIRKVLDDEEAERFVGTFGVKEPGNWHDEATGRATGTNILHLSRALDDDSRARWGAAREKLFAVREKRVHPHKDDKVLTDWNGLMIAALAKAARVFDEPEYTKAAERAAGFIQRKLRTPDGRLLHRWRDGQADIPAYAEDHAFLIWGLLELYETTFEVEHLKTALTLNKDLLTHFRDDAAGGLFHTADDAEKLLVRQKKVYDGAIPSGNSVAALNFVRLARITGEADLEKKADGIGRAFSDQVTRVPRGFTQLLVAVDFLVGPSYEVVIAGAPDREDTRTMLEALRSRYLPNKVVLLRTDDLARIAPFTKAQTPIDGKATAYVCRDFTCSAPTTDVTTMLEQLGVKP